MQLHSIKINENYTYVGVNDRETERFEGQWPLPNGVSYNSYIVCGEKTALLDAVKVTKIDDFKEKIEEALGGKPLDYLVVHHMEPDHSSSIEFVREWYPDVKIVGNKATRLMLKAFYGIDEILEVGEGDTLDLGDGIELTFYRTPMVHWPESMVSYEKKYKTLFSQDAFGSFGTLDGGIFDDELNWAYYEDEARRYFTNIVGKFYAQVRPALKKLSALDIKQIFPIHGPLHRSHPERILKCYEDWCNLKTEEGVVIVYGSMYGNTARAADVFARALAEEGIKNIRLFDVSKTHASFIQSEIWKYKGLVVASCTYNNGLFFPMVALCHILKANRLTNRVFATFGSYSWSGGALKELKAFGEECKYDMIDDFVEFKSAPTKEDLEHLRAVAKKMAARIRETADEA